MVEESRKNLDDQGISETNIPWTTKYEPKDTSGITPMNLLMQAAFAVAGIGTDALLTTYLGGGPPLPQWLFDLFGGKIDPENEKVKAIKDHGALGPRPNTIVPEQVQNAVNGIGEKCTPDFKRFSDPETAKRLGIEKDQLHEIKKIIIAKARANQNVAKALKKIKTENPDILLTRDGDIGLQMPRSLADKLEIKHPPSVQTGLNITDLH